jgi:CHAD domain-containing protein
VSTKCTLAPQVAACLLKGRVEVMLGHLDATRGQDPDGIHDMRVASRRIRSFLAEHAPLMANEPFQRFQNRVRSITVALGQPRELDVCLEILESHKETMHSAAPLAYDHVACGLGALRKAVAGQPAWAVELAHSAHFGLLLDDVLKSLRPTEDCYLDLAAGSLRKRAHKLEHAYAQWQKNASEKQLHDIRKRFKKLRYACELYRDHFGERMEAFTRRLKTVQQSLGDWNDWRVLRNYAQALLDEAAPALVGDGDALNGLIQGQVDTHLKQFHETADAFFTPALKEDMRPLLRPAKEICPVRTCSRVTGR